MCARHAQWCYLTARDDINLDNAKVLRFNLADAHKN